MCEKYLWKSDILNKDAGNWHESLCKMANLLKLPISVGVLLQLYLLHIFTASFVRALCRTALVNKWSKRTVVVESRRLSLVPNNRRLCLFSISKLLLGPPIIDFLLYLRKAWKILMLQGSKLLSWNVDALLSHFDEFPNPTHSLRFIETIRVFSGPKSVQMFNINYTTHSDTKKKTKNLANYL